jgi:predicted nucleic acid-binding protein
MPVLVDSNVIIDVMQGGPWLEWSRQTLARVGDAEAVLINPIVYAEVAVGFASVEELDEALPESDFGREDLPWEAGFLAGRAFLDYRRAGGARSSPLPDFYIGAHAQVRGYRLLTRDVARYRTYFPNVPLICPGTA